MQCHTVKTIQFKEYIFWKQGSVGAYWECTLELKVNKEIKKKESLAKKKAGEENFYIHFTDDIFRSNFLNTSWKAVEKCDGINAGGFVLSSCFKTFLLTVSPSSCFYKAKGD